MLQLFLFFFDVLLVLFIFLMYMRAYEYINAICHIRARTSRRKFEYFCLVYCAICLHAIQNCVQYILARAPSCTCTLTFIYVRKNNLAKHRIEEKKLS